MAIGHHLKTIARGSRGARDLPREQACELFGQVLDGTASDLEIGAFCIAMRVKGESPEELAGFLDALHARLAAWPAGPRPPVVLPCYNGARKLPVLTPLLALLLAREGLPVLVHGMATEERRVTTQAVLSALGVPTLSAPAALANGSVQLAPTALLHPGLARLLDVRRTLGLRNSGHSLVKLLNPLAATGARALVVGSYTHREYAQSMAAAYALVGADALLLRGTEGEPVADARRMPQMDGFVAGSAQRLEEADTGGLAAMPDWPANPDLAQTVALVERMLCGALPVPAPLARQLEHLCGLARRMEAPHPADTASGGAA